jgi:hypothetical protein
MLHGETTSWLNNWALIQMQSLIIRLVLNFMILLSFQLTKCKAEFERLNPGKGDDMIPCPTCLSFQESEVTTWIEHYGIKITQSNSKMCRHLKQPILRTPVKFQTDTTPIRPFIRFAHLNQLCSIKLELATLPICEAFNNCMEMKLTWIWRKFCWEVFQFCVKSS